ncbi:MAG: hypothetical protein RO469_18630 [Thermincola sp.]|nr:hypothetical protein [Thermincola sp.]MDT3705001.1 hypothetical protein [Thermincola sp.]
MKLQLVALDKSELKLGDMKLLKINEDIAIGHANTASGARLVMTLAYELRRRGGYGVAAICGGLG